MSVNMRFGIDQERTRKRQGKVFHTIDFESNPNYRGEDYVKKSSTSSCGTFLIDGKQTKVTIQELERIVETAQAGLETLRKAYKLGSLAK